MTKLSSNGTGTNRSGAVYAAVVTDPSLFSAGIELKSAHTSTRVAAVALAYAPTSGKAFTLAGITVTGPEWNGSAMTSDTFPTGMTGDLVLGVSMSNKSANATLSTHTSTGGTLIAQSRHLGDSTGSPADSVTSVSLGGTGVSFNTSQANGQTYSIGVVESVVGLPTWLLGTAEYASTPTTTSGAIAVTAPVGSTVVVSTLVNNTATVEVTDTGGHTWNTHTPSVPASGTVSSAQMFWTKITTADPSITVTRNTSGALAVQILTVDGDVSGSPSLGNAASVSAIDLPTVSAGMVIFGLATLAAPTRTPASGWTELDVQTVGTRSLVTYLATPTGTIEPDVSFSATSTASGVALRLVAVDPDALPTVTGHGFTSVQQMLETFGATWAHRNLGGTYPEMTEYGTRMAANAGYGVIEISVQRTSDGVLIGSHDATPDRVAQETTYDGTNFTALTSTQVLALHANVGSTGAPKPFATLTQLVETLPEDFIFLVDNKPGSYMTEFLALLDSLGGPTKFIVKIDGSATYTRFQQVQAAGYKTAAYFYDTTSSSKIAENMPYVDLPGLNYNADQSYWDSLLAYGKPIWGHVCVTQANADMAMAKGATFIQSTSVAIAPVGVESWEAPLEPQVWTGTALDATEIFGEWNGTSVESVEVLGNWTGATIEVIEEL